MNYIINPAWFYWIGVASNLSCAAAFMAISGVILLCILGFIYFDMIASYRDEEELSLVKKAIKITVVIVPILFLFAVLIPSKEVMLSMMVAKFATYDNAQWTLDTVKDAVDYIVNAMQQIG